MFSRVSHFLFGLMLFPLMACAADQNQYEDGVHYITLPEPVATQTGDKVEVAEIFWYGCGHCYTFEPLVNQWEKSLPDGVELVKSPAMWNEPMKVHAQMFYTAEALGVFDRVHQNLFNAMHVERKRLMDADEIYPYFEDVGVSREDFDKTFKSFKVSSDVRRADARARSYKISGTPEIVVNGKYRISARMTGSQANMLKVARYLVDKELAAK